ncbi:DUF4124 domain-containing protein [Aliivibrio wodanis]|uniref:DUF4124 domain-containing protein n=1 Tax=Aliivibrio wodanis TaxID=80852 RepID=UPI00406C3E82
MPYKLLIPLILLSASSLANTVYTWEDSDGTRHFSDSAPPSHISSKALSLESESIEEIPVNKPSSAKKSNTKKKTKASSEAKKTKLEVTISNLVQEETIRSSRGHIMVLTELTRKLAIDEKLQLMLDGSPYGLPQTTTEWKLTNIDRGTHLITVVAKKDGKRIASSPIITIYLHRPSSN